MSCGENKNNLEPGPGPEPGPEPEPEPEVITDYYVSLEGSGTMDGTSAANAMNFEALREFILQPLTEVEIPAGEGEEPVIDIIQDDEKAFEMAAKLDGITVHFADGTYVLNSTITQMPGEGGEALEVPVFVPAKIEFSGYEKQVEITFEGSQNAILSGDEKYRVLTIGNQVALTINGMCVKDGNLEAETANEDGAGILIAAGESGNATLNANGTLFSNNRNKEGKSGGAVRVAKGTFNATNCVFDELNYARNGGSIFTNSDAAEVHCTACTFKSSSYNTGGAANNSGGKQYYENCLFDGCFNKAGAGGAIHANASGSVVVVENCTFKKCRARINDAAVANKDSGIISVQTCDFTINNSLFEECEGISGAIILLQSSMNLFKCNNTAFIGNKASDRGLIANKASGSNDIASVGFFNNCVFYNNTMSTNQWGFILHGGNPGVAAFNNCTFYGNTRGQAGGNGVGLNSDGSIILLNSTFIEADDLVSVRANTNDARNCVLLANSIVLNTSEGKPFIASDKMKSPKCGSYNCILGSVYTAPETFVFHGDVKDATMETLNGSYNANTKLYVWNGSVPEGFTKMSAEEFETILKQGASARPTNQVHPYLGEKTIGEAFYEWLNGIGAIGKDAAGTSRGNSWWPGAYQAN